MSGRRSTAGWRLPPEVMAAVAEYGQRTGRSATRAAEVLILAALRSAEGHTLRAEVVDDAGKPIAELSTDVCEGVTYTYGLTQGWSVNIVADGGRIVSCHVSREGAQLSAELTGERFETSGEP